MADPQGQGIKAQDMDLRTWFAGMAIPKFTEVLPQYWTDQQIQHIVKACYKLADAMLVSEGK